MNELLQRLYGLIRPQDVQQAATSPITSPQLGMLNRVLGLSTGQAQTALQRMPEQLAQSQAMLESYTPGGRLDPRLMDQFMNLATMAPMGMFVGAKSSLWDAIRARQAAEMEAAGVNPRDIWKETLTGRGPDKNWKQELDISDIKVDTSKVSETPVPISQVVQQRDLLGSYPQVFDIQVARELRPGIGGSFNPAESVVSLSPEAQSVFKSAGMEPRQIMAHEVQHAIQNIEGWPMGGSLETAGYQLTKSREKALEGLLGDRATWNNAFNDLVNADRSLYMHQLQKLSVQNNVKPRQIFNLSDWYKYGRKYTNEAGLMPKKPGAARDKWLNDAAAFIKAKNIEEKPFLESLQSELSVKEAKNMAARANRKMSKVAEKNKEFLAQTSKFKNLESMSDMEKYKRLYGEAEARLAQNRLTLTEQQRREMYPFEYKEGYESGLDVPVDQLFYYTR